MISSRSAMIPIIALALALSAPDFTLAQSAEDVPDELKAQTLFISVRTCVTSGAESSDWSARSIRQTLSGTPVVLKLSGTNVVILVQITAYITPERRIVVVAQSQVTVMKDEKVLNRSVSMYTMTVKPGEVIVFYPMGLAPSGSALPSAPGAASGAAGPSAGADPANTLKVEIMVEDYEAFSKRSESSFSPVPEALPAQSATTSPGASREGS